MKTKQVIEMAQDLSGRWTIPILLSLKEAGGRFTPLQHRLDISPSRLSDNLKKLESKGIVRHLSPYERRHPLLPEYELTDKGLLLQEAARSVQLTENALHAGPLSAKPWNWPVVLAIHYECRRFQAIRHMLQEATPRILSMRIDALCQTGLVDKLLTAVPRPGYDYLLAASAEQPVKRMESDLLSLL